MEKTGGSVEVSPCLLGANHWYEKYLFNKALIHQVLESYNPSESDLGNKIPSLFTLSRRKLLESKVHDYDVLTPYRIFPGSNTRFSGCDYLITGTNYHYCGSDNQLEFLSPPQPMRQLLHEYTALYHRNGKPCDNFSAFAESRNPIMEPLAYEYQLLSGDRTHIIQKDFLDSNFLTLMSVVGLEDVTSDDTPGHGRLLPMPHQVSLDTARILDWFHFDLGTYLCLERYPSYQKLKPVHSFTYNFIARDDNNVAKIYSDLEFSYCATTFEPFEVSRLKMSALYNAAPFSANLKEVKDLCHKHNYEFATYPCFGSCDLVDKDNSVYSCVDHMVDRGVKYCIDIISHDICVPTMFSIFVGDKVWYPLGCYLDFLDLGKANSMDLRTLTGLVGKDMVEKFSRRWYSTACNYDILAGLGDL